MASDVTLVAQELFQTTLGTRMTCLLIDIVVPARWLLGRGRSGR